MRTSRATGDRARASGLIHHATRTNSTAFSTTNHNALRAEIVPEGISRPLVRGFCASIRRSAQRLNPIAVLRASTMAKSTLTSTGHSNGRPLDCSAYTYPTNAKGSANIVWENLTSDA